MNENEKSYILIVDDIPENIRVLGTALRQKDYRVTIAQSGKQALEVIDEHIPDLILLDIMMPDMNGFQVCEILKANPKTQNIEIIFITAAITDSDELAGLQLGAIDYIHKPFSVPLLQARIARHLERIEAKKELRLKNDALKENARLRDDIERMSRHDLKTPLNAVLGYSQLLLMDDDLNAEQRESVEEILRAGNEMTNMINNSLDLFRMETGSYSYEPECVDISLVIHTIIKDLKSMLEQKQLKTVIHQQPSTQIQPGQVDKMLVLAEKGLSYSLFGNLLRNAVEACAVNDCIRIDMGYEDKYGVIAITNPGSVPESIRKTFFEKYATAGKSKGTGLGTYSAKLMTETQKGTIAMTTNDKETCITVRLPYQKT